MEYFFQKHVNINFNSFMTLHRYTYVALVNMEYHGVLDFDAIATTIFL